MKLECLRVNVATMLRTYAVLVAAGGLSLLEWGGRWFPESARVVQVGVGFLAAAGVAAVLSGLGNAAFRKRALFWFGIGHFVLWVAAVAFVGFGRGDGLDSKVRALAAGAAFLLHYFWLIAEGELSDRGTSPAPLVSIFNARAKGVILSQYERKIRQAAAQEERNRLARDLHDSIKQQIFAIQTAAAAAQVRLQGDNSGARDALEQVRSAAREAMTEMEVMLDQLRAEPLESTGLVAALRKLCESIGFRTGAQVDFSVGTIPGGDRLSPSAAEATLRVAQEALANVARHARAKHVGVRLDSVGNRMELAVTDDGAGFDPAEGSGGMGTANMRARAEELGGSLDLTSGPGQGTSVRFAIPFAPLAWATRRRRVATLWIMMLVWWAALTISGPMQRWSFVPLLVYVTGLAVMHYVKTYARAGE